MQENNFEKRVQTELDGLMLNPSGDVWLKVEASLKKKKDRRGWLLLLTLFVLLAGGIFTFKIFNSKDSKATNNSALASADQTLPAGKSTPESPALDSNNTIAPEAEKPLTEEQPSDSQQSRLPVEKPGSDLAQKDISTKNITSSVTSEIPKSNLQKAKKYRAQSGARTTVQISGAIVETMEDEAIDINVPVELEKQNAVFTADDIAVKKEAARLPLISELNAKNLMVPEIIPAISLSVLKKKKRPVSNKITLSLEAGIGRSGTANSYLGTIPNSSFYDYNPAASNNNTGSSGVPDSLQSYNVTPSAVKPGIGLFAGLLFTKKVTSYSSISTGIRYQLLTTSQSVGATVTNNTTANNLTESAVYKAGIANQYSNFYHLLQLPIEFNTQASRFKQYNIFATAGFSISQLVHTNSLQFDNATRQYFKNNQYFNKTIIGFSAGLFVNLQAEAKAQLLIGPVFQYSLTPLASKGLYANSHYSFLGLRLIKSLKKQ